MRKGRGGEKEGEKRRGGEERKIRQNWFGRDGFDI